LFIYYHLQITRGNTFVACVCLSVCPARPLTFEFLDPQTLVFGTQVHLQIISVTVEYQGHVSRSMSRSNESK